MKKTGIRVLIAAALFSWIAFGAGIEDQKKSSRLEGEYRIYLSGQEIGVEKYVVIFSGDVVTSAGNLEFRSPVQSSQKVTMETRLEMDAQFRPRNYELKSEVEGKKGTIRGEFAPNQVIFTYTGGGVSSRTGLLVGERYSILDTNAFHHFIFLSQLFKYGSSDKGQRFEVVIPQEKETGAVTITEIGKEDVQINAKTVNLIHLAMDSGALKIQMWVDADRVPRKIAVPEKGIEVIHS